MLQAFFDMNRRASRRLEARLPHVLPDLYAAYDHAVAGYMNARPHQLIVDVGGGRECRFARYRQRDRTEGTRIVAVDISADEIDQNRDVDEVRIADVAQDLPFAAGEVDMVVSSSVVEHLQDVDAFVSASARVLKPGGMFIHLLPMRFALFAMINRMMPAPVAKRTLYFFQPKVAGLCGFPACYDQCYPSRLLPLLESRGFAVKECEISYFQSRYYNFFFPAYAASAAYELAVRAIGVRNLGAYMLIVAQRT